CHQQTANLTYLYFRDNKLTNVPDAISQLQQLTILDLSFNKLTNVPDVISKLQKLTSLDLSRNQLTNVPDAIIQLQNLTTLYLSGNKLTSFPNTISQLQKLTSLDLSFNELTNVPDAIIQLQKLTSLDLQDNPIETPPPEVVNKGIQAIRKYFRQTQTEGTDYLYEAKLLIVGEAGAGKTTLAKKIEDENYQLQEEDSTKGIEVIQWRFPIENGKDFRVNIWDFGGQEIYHATHQFFLTKRSLYILVADTRKEDTDFYYWLNVVELLSNNSPLLIVKNEKQNRHREINERQLRGQFTNLKETLATNLATNRGLPEVLNNIQHYIKSLSHIGSELPKTWVRVKETLESDPRDYISLEEYLEICQKNGFTQRQDKLQLSDYLHDLGVCLHFQDDPILNNTVILKPEWGTYAVYRVLDDTQVITNRGEFTWNELTNIWQEEKYAAKQGELLRLMMKFKLCYEIYGNNKTYIAPQLLTENKPEYQWDEIGNLILRYTYDFMPKGIITQFIVVMHKFIEAQPYVWKSGVILNKDETRAEVIEYYDKREIKIRVAGKYKRDLMTIVTHELDKIHASYKRLKYSTLIPCNCSMCKDDKNQQEPHFYPLSILRQFSADGQDTIQCQKSYQMVPVRGLIEDAIGRRQLEREIYQGDGLRPHSSVKIEGNVGTVVFQPSNQENYLMTEPSQQEETSQPTLPWAYRNGLFYLLVFAVVFNTIGIFAGSLPIYSLALTIIATTIIIITIGVLQLRQDNRLSETSFVKLTEIVLEQLPLIGNVIKQWKSSK
ncbi:COR domain-containing protein, partial [Calothrix rhizosoleniae]|uniref:COR domain-containing protein n=1 Tax=Calothrix rhizosoleniae TaxID=888997 RepID=UPI001178419E